MKNETFDITVLVTSYNNADYIRQCIQSVMDSDFDHKKMEIVIVDDASTDDSVAIIEKMMADSPVEFRLFRNEVNIGACRSRNRGISQARGEFIYLLDSDDYLHKDCLQHHFHFMSQNPDFIACYAPVQEFDNETEKFLKILSNKPFDYQQLVKGPYICGVALFNTKALIDVGMLNTNLPPYGWIDYELWLRLGKMEKKVHFLGGEPLYYYRRHKNTITKGIDFNKMKLLIDYLRIEHPLELDIQKGPSGKIINIHIYKEAQLFLSDSEEGSIKERIVQESQRFEFKLSPSQKIKTLRFDPINDFAMLRLDSVQLQYKGQPIDKQIKISSNAVLSESGQLFFHTTDPQIYFELNETTAVDTVIINIKYLKTGAGALIELQHLQNEKAAQMEELVTAMKAINGKNEAEIDKLIDEKNTNYRRYIEALSELATLRESRFISAMIKINNLMLSVFRFKMLKKTIEKLQLALDVLTIQRSILFDPQYYLSKYPDVAGSDMTAEKHFLRYGWKEGRNPSHNFDTAFYLANNRDVLVLGKNPLIHYIKKGQYENRNIQPVPDSSAIQLHFSESRHQILSFLKLNRNRKRIIKPHLSYPVDDFALEVPFDFEMPLINPKPAIAVFCHIYYEDLTNEIKAYLLNIPDKFDVYITTNTIEKKNIITSKFDNWDKGKVAVEVFENRGRDIAPKLLAWKEIYNNYEFFLHIHSKKSLHQETFKSWRIYLFNNLLGSEKIVKSIFEAFNSDPSLGMIGTHHFLNIRSFTGWGYNFEKAKQFAKKAGVDLKINGRVDFPSGSMFWGRTAAIRPILENIKDLSVFEEELGQVDGTFAHVIERLCYFSCEKAGYKWIKIFDPSTAQFHQRTLAVANREMLIQLIDEIQTPLIAEKGKTQNSKEENILEKLYFLKIQSKSPYKNWPNDLFYEQLKLHIEKKESLIDFDEDFYLTANTDVKSHIKTGAIECGFVHYYLNGKDEKRLWSSKHLSEKFKLKPFFPDGFFAPVHIHKHFDYKVQQLLLPKSPDPFLLIFVSDLQKELFFAGYHSFFEDFRTIFKHFAKVIIAVSSENFDPELVNSYSDHIEVIHQSKLELLQYAPDVMVGYNHFETLKALWIFGQPEKVAYYCQDYEPGFFSLGTDFLEAQSAITKPRNIILSTELLRVFLENEGLINQSNVFVTSPKIEVLDVLPEKTKKLFFYFRPEKFNTRNIPEIIWETVHEFCSRHTGYELYLAGTIETRFSIELNGNELYVLSKLPKAEYMQLLVSCDVAVAMIYSAHPGVIAFQAAASGIPTVTNIFKNRDAQKLKAISENIIPFDPLRESLCEKVEEALQQAKGKKHFFSELYSGKPQSLSLSEYILKIAER